MRMLLAYESAFAVTVLVFFAVAEGCQCSAAEPSSDERRIVGKGYYFQQERVGKAHAQLQYWETPEKSLQFARDHPSSDTVDEALLDAAWKLAKRQKYTEAMRITDEVISKYEHSAFSGISSSWDRAAGFTPEPILKARRYIRNHPDFSVDVAMYMKAEFLEHIGKQVDAIRLLQAYVKRFPQGRWAKEDREFIEAFGERKAYRLTHAELHRTHEYIFLALARLHYQRREYVEAVKVLRQARQAFPLSPLLPTYYDLLAKTYQQTGTRDKEEEALGQMRRLAKLRWYTTACSFFPAYWSHASTRQRKGKRGTGALIDGTKARSR